MVGVVVAAVANGENYGQAVMLDFMGNLPFAL
jgi:hypothetical protein